MKARLFLVLLILSCASLPLLGQSQNVQSFTLDDGTRVLYQIQTDVDMIDSGLNQSYQNTIERTLRDQGRAWLGFEIHIERINHGDTFRISMEPISGWPFFAEPPAPREIHSGDRVMLDIMEQPSTGKKIFDSFQVGLPNTAMQPMPSGRHTIAQIPQQKLMIRLDRPIFSGKDTTEMTSPQTKRGTKLSVTVPGLGRFLFASYPETGFHMEAVAEDRVLNFIAGADRYRIDCFAPVMETPGAWYLWVKFEPSSSQNAPKNGSFRANQLLLEDLGNKSNAP